LAEAGLRGRDGEGMGGLPGGMFLVENFRSDSTCHRLFPDLSTRQHYRVLVARGIYPVGSLLPEEFRSRILSLFAPLSPNLTAIN